jgi:hypothetical protein
MTDELYAHYNAAIGSLMLARKHYADACEEQGPDSWAAEQAKDYLDREIAHRDQLREQYDAVARGRPAGSRDV